MKVCLNLKNIWTLSLMLYIICSSAFSYGSLRMLNTYALYFFLGVSLINILSAKKIKLNVAIVSIALYAILLLIGVLYTPTSDGQVREVMYKYITMVIIVFCVVQYMDSVKDIRQIMWAYMLAGVALAIYVYAQYGSEFWTIMQEATENEFGQVDRLGSELTNANTVGMITIIGAVIAIYNIIFEKASKWKRILCALIGIFCFLVSMAAASKKSIIIILVVFLVMWLYGAAEKESLSRRLRSFVVVVGCFLIFVWIVNTLPIFSGIAARIESLLEVAQGGDGTLSEENRLAFISKGIEVWLNYPLFGEGSAASISHFGVYSHNNFVEVLMNTGIVGFVLFYIAYPATVYRYMINKGEYRKTGCLPVLLLSLFLGVTVCGFALVYYYERYYMILIAVIASAVNVFEREKAQLQQPTCKGETL